MYDDIAAELRRFLILVGALLAVGFVAGVLVGRYLVAAC
jgi:hypothetical protein